MLSKLNRKGATKIELVIGYVVVMAIIVVFFYFLFSNLAEMAVIADSDTTSKDLGTLLEVSYASPGNLYVEYQTPSDNMGFPAIGSLLVNADNSQIKTHPYTEDEMWYEISNDALSAWGLGAASKGVYELRKEMLERAQKQARAKAGTFSYEANRIAYEEKIYYGLSADEQKAMDSILSDDSIHKSFIASVTNRESIYALGEVNKNAVLMKQVEKNPKFMEKLADLADASPAKRAVMIEELHAADELGVSHIMDYDTYTFLKSQQGEQLLTSLKNGPSSTDALRALGKSGNGADAIVALKTFKGTKVQSLLSVADGVASGDLVKVFSTKGGQDVLSMFRGGATVIDPTLYSKGEFTGTAAKWSGLTAGYDKARPGAVTQRRIGREIRKTASKQDQAAEYLAWSKSDEAAEFRKIVGTDTSIVSGKDYSTLMHKIEETGGDVDVLKADKDVQEILKKAGIADDAADGALKGAIGFNKFPVSKYLGDDGAWRARKLLVDDDGIRAIEGIMDAATKNKGMAKQLGKAGTYTELSGLSLFRRGMSQLTGAAKTAIVYSAGKFGGQAAVDSTSAFLGKAGKSIGEGASIGLGNAGSKFAVFPPLDACAKNNPEPISAVACTITAAALWTVQIGMDFFSTTLPMIMMIYEGHQASNDLKAKDSNFYYIGDSEKIYADPPNCGVETKPFDFLKGIGTEYLELGKEYGKAELETINLISHPELSLSYAWDLIGGNLKKIMLVLNLISPVLGSIGRAFPGTECTAEQLTVDGVSHHLELDGECTDNVGYCPNYYISSNAFGSLGPVDVDQLSQVGAYGFSFGTTLCAGLGWASLTAGGLCYLGYYASIITSFATVPQYSAPMMTGCNIYRQDDYWYVQSPTSVQIYRSYNPETGEQEVSIYAE